MGAVDQKKLQPFIFGFGMHVIFTFSSGLSVLLRLCANFQVLFFSLNNPFQNLPQGACDASFIP